MPIGGSSGGASSGAVRAGAAYVEAYLKDNKFVSGLEGIKRRMSAFGSVLMGFGKQSAIAGGLIAAPLLAAASHFAKTGDDLNKMSQRTGVSVETLSELAYAAGQSGSSLEELGIGMKGMAKFTAALIGGSKEAADALDEMGISALEFLDSSPEKRFEMLADGIDSIVDPQLKAAAAMNVFGKAGEGMLPMLEGGSKAIAQLRQEAASLGKTVTKEQAENATRLGDAWDRVKAATLGVVFTIGSALAPGLELVAGHLKTGAVAIADFMRENKALAVIIGGAAAGLIAAGIAAMVMGVAMKGLALGVGIVSASLGLLGGLIGFLLSPIGMVVAAIAGISALFLTQTEAGKRFADNIGANFNNIAATAKNAWSGIAAAIAKGDLELAAKIAFTTIKLAWSEAIQWLTERWVGFKKTFRNGWADLGTGIRLMWNDVTSALGKGLAWVLDKALWLFRNTIGLIFDGLSWAAKELGFDNTAKDLKRIGAVRFDSPEVNREIEADRIKKRNEILADAARAQAERGNFWQNQINEAMKDVNANRDELNRLVADAKRNPDGQIPGAGGPDPGSPEAHRAAQIKLGEMSKGLFQSPNWKQSFAVGDKIQQKQLAVQLKQLQTQRAIQVALQAVQILRLG